MAGCVCRLRAVNILLLPLLFEVCCGVLIVSYCYYVQVTWHMILLLHCCVLKPVMSLSREPRPESAMPTKCAAPNTLTGGTA